jgi:peptidoglycan/LPS O-acetylase OafA/YrhL
VLMVLGRHMEEPPQIFPSFLQTIVDRWHLSGGLGVDLFFVLSGFLVSGLLFAEFKQHGDLSVKRFYLRRGWKIYPAFYFLIAFTFICHFLVYGVKMRDRPLFTELFFIQNYQQAYWNHTWTLAVEEHFYILLPLLLLFLVRRNPGAANPFRALPYIVAGAAIAILGGRMLNYAVRSDYSFHTHAWPTHLRIDALFFGVVLGYAHHFRHEWFHNTFRPWRYALIGLGLALFFVPLPLGEYGHLYGHTFGFTQHYLGAAAILVGTLMCAIPNNRITLTLATVGGFSYSIYLWHMALMYYAIPPMREAGVPWSVRTLIFLAGAFVIGIVMAKLLELPVLNFRDRMFPSRSGSALELSDAAGDRPTSARQAA